MATAAYPTAAIPEPYQILGLRLKPLSLGHYLLMERFNVAFVSSIEATATQDDLILGVLICSMTYEEFINFLDEPDHIAQIKSWGEKCGAYDLNEKVKLFKEYIDAASKQPVVIYEQGASNESGAHWAQTIKLTLTGQLGYTEHEAINLPLSQAFSDFWKHAENQGAVTFATPEVAAALEGE